MNTVSTNIRLHKYEGYRIIYARKLTLCLSGVVGGGCLITCFTVCIKVSKGKTRTAPTRSTSKS